MTPGAASDAVKAARPMLNGGREETCRKVTRLAPTQHHQSGTVLAYVFGRRQDTVFLQLQALLAPFGITRYYTDGWGAYERHVAAEQHTVGKVYTQKIESKHINLRTRINAVGVSHDLLFEDGTHARSGDRALHQSVRVWTAHLKGNQHLCYTFIALTAIVFNKTQQGPSARDRCMRKGMKHDYSC